MPMNWRKKALRSFRLYIVTDRITTEGLDTVEIARCAISGGADVIQLRDKQVEAHEFLKVAHQLRILTRRTMTLFLINDRADIALACDADGVHLGQKDLPVKVARKILGRERLIGVSTHSLEQARAAQDNDVDYIGVGPIFATPTKPDYIPVGLDLIREVKSKLKIPFVAIGGININNIDEVIDAGAERVAVVRAVVGAKDVEKAARELKNRLLFLR